MNKFSFVIVVASLRRTESLFVTRRQHRWKREYGNRLPNEKVRFFERFELSDLRWKQRLRHFSGNKAPEPCLLPLLCLLLYIFSWSALIFKKHAALRGSSRRWTQDLRLSLLLIGKQVTWTVWAAFV